MTLHIAFFSDQHPATLGGLQVSLGLQRDYLEQAGHTVTVCSPDSKCKPSPQFSRPGDIELRAMQVGDHSFQLAGPPWDRSIDAGFDKRPPVDLVHIQADVWGAWNGYRFARRHGLHLVHTMHTNIEVGLPAVVPFSRAVFPLLFAAQGQYMHADVHDMSSYVRAFADAADAVIVPSSHFAQTIHNYGVQRDLNVIPTGVDDRLIDSVGLRERKKNDRTVFVWPGRLSEEKRATEVIEAFAQANINAELHFYGSGPEEKPSIELSRSLGVDGRVFFHGTVSHEDVMRAMAGADVVVQSSLGYETQGLTVYEAISVGTSVLVRDHAIASALPERWCHTVADESIGAMAQAFRDVNEQNLRGELADLTEPHSQFRQSQLTQKIIELYEKTLSTRPRALDFIR